MDFPRVGEAGKAAFGGEELLHQSAFAQGELLYQLRLLLDGLVPHAQYLGYLPLLRQRRNSYFIFATSEEFTAG